MENTLPEGWEWKRLDEVSDIIMGQSPPGNTYNEKGNGMPFLQGKAEFTDLYPQHVKYTTNPSKVAPEGSILISVRAPVGDVNIANIGYCIGRGLASISLRDGDNKFLFYLLRYLKPEIENKGTGSTFKAISKSILSDLTVPLPPLETQKKVVTILEKAEETKKLRAQADELTQKLLQSVFLEMFGDSVENTKNWDKKALKEFGEIITGNTPPRKKPEYYGDYIEWIKSDNINTPYTYLTKSEEMLSEKGVKVGRIAPINSVLVTCIAGSLSCIGNVAIADRDVAFNQQINAIVPNENVNALFLYHLILNTKEYIQNHSTQSMKGMISKGVFSSISFIMPQIESQVKFAEYAKKVEEMIISQNQSFIEINSLFDALMQKAFTGEIIS